VASPATGRRLLLVGEDSALATLVALAAARLGVEIVSVASGRAALEVIARRPPSVAVLDLPLADVRGSEVLAALARARVPSLAVSGVYRGPRAAEEVRRLGATDFFEKPFAVEALAAAVARALGVAAPGLDEAVDEVTGSRPLRPEEESGAIAAAPLPALEDGPVTGGPGGRDGLAAPLPEQRRARHAVEAGPPPARGDLARTTVPRLLVAVHQGQASGALTIARGPVKKILVFEAGAPVYAASNVGAERFGAICVRRGVVTQELLDALRRGAPPAARTAELLAEAGLLPPAKRIELLGGQVRAIAWSAFEWREGGYAFQLGRPPAERTPLRLPMGDLVLEGILRTATLPRLHAELPREIHLAPSPDPAFELYALGVRPKEAHLLSLADGTKSVADLVRLSEMEERDALAFLQACRVMRVLDEVERVLASTRRIGFM
jgi:two-component system, OmpR family, response regulator